MRQLSRGDRAPIRHYRHEAWLAFPIEREKVRDLAREAGMGRAVVARAHGPSLLLRVPSEGELRERAVRRRMQKAARMIAGPDGKRRSLFENARGCFGRPALLHDLALAHRDGKVLPGRRMAERPRLFVLP